jgi:phage tail-like protein
MECDYLGNPIRQHTCDECWSSKFSAPEFDASSSEVAIETVEIQYEDMRTEVL